MMNEKVEDIIRDEVSNFHNFTSGYILENYELGVNDVIVRFIKGDVQILENGHLLDEKEIVKVRCGVLANTMGKAYAAMPDLLESLDLIIPVCLSDTSDSPLQDIPCLVFSKTAYSNNILIPSINNLTRHQEIEFIDVCDEPLESKVDKMCFVGSLTGVGEDLPGSARLAIADMASGDGRFFCRIMRPPRVSEEDFSGIIKQCKGIYNDLDTSLFLNQDKRFGFEQQLEYKFQLCIDGHTCPWARLPWQMAANCIPIKIRNRKNDWREWFYPLLNPSKHFIETDIDNVLEAYEYLVGNTHARRDINEAGQAFVKEYLSEEFAVEYMARTLYLLNQMQDNTYHNKKNAGNQ